MDKITSGTIKMTWISEARLAFIRFESETCATGKDATVLANALTHWIGTHCRPFGLLGDGGRLANADEGRPVPGYWEKALRYDTCADF